MKLRIAYIEEPPFSWKGEDHSVKRVDIDWPKMYLERLVYLPSNIS